MVQKVLCTEIGADGVKFDRIELDHDDGVWQYEFFCVKVLTQKEKYGIVYLSTVCAEREVSLWIKLNMS